MAIAQDASHGRKDVETSRLRCRSRNFQIKEVFSLDCIRVEEWNTGGLVSQEEIWRWIGLFCTRAGETCELMDARLDSTSQPNIGMWRTFSEVVTLTKPLGVIHGSVGTRLVIGVQEIRKETPSWLDGRKILARLH